MNRQRIALALAFALVASGSIAFAQAARQGAAPATPSQGANPPARGRLVAPVRGVAELGYTKPVVKAGKIGGKDFVITTIQVKNISTGSIAGLRVEEFWYDRAGNPVTGDDYRHPRPLQPNEVITVTLETPRQGNMDRNQYNFKHANGDIKPVLQARMTTN